MLVSGYQPHYFPRLHYLQRALSSDVFEISDYLQFVRKHEFHLPNGEKIRDKSYQAHAPIKLTSGIYYLVVPTVDHMQVITETPIVYEPDWIQKHTSSLKSAYGKAPQFRHFYPEVERLLFQKYVSLGELTIKTVLWSIMRMISDEPITEVTLDTANSLLRELKHPFQLQKIVLASQTGVAAPTGDPSKWIVDLCQKLQATEYITGGSAGRAYMDFDLFKKMGIAVKVQNWKCKEYVQRYPQVGFLPNLSALDLIFNEPLSVRVSMLQ